ncbi:hypothetical protein [Streptomyces synnematoformans]
MILVTTLPPVEHLCATAVPVRASTLAADVASVAAAALGPDRR